MLIGDIRIVDSHVRIYDVDGSYQELTIEDALRLYAWVASHHYRLLEEQHLRRGAEKRKDS